MVTYLSTRGGVTGASFTDVLLTGLAPDGGLFIPESWPKFDEEALMQMKGSPYVDVAYQVIAPFVGDDIPSAHLKAIIDHVYKDKFDHAAVAPLVQIGPNSWTMELFRGPTLAFKDYALQLLGQLFDYVLEQRGERITIVGATSGDTGSAAIEACRKCKNIDIFILHPNGRTSDVQRRQMTTIDSPNVFNIALEGNFDDCQNIVKAMFNDADFNADVNLSAVNSINWARIMAQIVYYFTSALSLGAPHRPVSFAVPTGNFGNVYAAHCARQMGLPIENLIIGSNRNDILTRFFETGTMASSAVEPSLSPSMDIQISSNFERFLCDALERDTGAVNAMMTTFKDKGEFSLNDEQMAHIRQEFSAARCNDEQTSEMMRACYAETGYMIDPHTAVGLFSAWQVQQNPTVPLIALACAHPAKFPDAVKEATGIHPDLPPHLSDLFERKEIYDVMPNDLGKLQSYVREHRQKDTA